MAKWCPCRRSPAAGRYRARWVWLGVSGAFVAHVVIAVTAGHALRRLPPTPLHVLVALLFAVGAVLLLRPPPSPVQAEAAVEADTVAARIGREPGPLRVVATCAAVVFVGEWGDITQIATADLAARYGDPLSVGVGAALGLLTAALLAVQVGSRLAHRLDVPAARRVGGLVLAAFAVLTVVPLL